MAVTKLLHDLGIMEEYNFTIKEISLELGDIVIKDDDETQLLIIEIKTINDLDETLIQTVNELVREEIKKVNEVNWNV